MIHKKTDRKAQARSRPSLVSRLLDKAAQATLQAPSPVEPWRNTKVNGKNKKKHK